MVALKTKEIFGQFLENFGTDQITIIKRNLAQLIEELEVKISSCKQNNKLDN